MRTRSFASALLVLLACAGPAQRDPPPRTYSKATLAAHADGARTRFEIQIAPAPVLTLSVDRDSMVAPDTEPTSVQVIGQLTDRAVIIADTYMSKPAGLSRCQAGEEQFLRIVSFSVPHPRETLRLKVASCRDELELTDTGIEWMPANASIRIHWLSGPKGVGISETRTIQIDADGTPGAQSSSPQ